MAPVIIREGGCGEADTESSRRGRVSWANKKNPFLWYEVAISIVFIGNAPVAYGSFDKSILKVNDHGMRYLES